MPKGVYIRKGYVTDRGAWIKRVIRLLYSRADLQKCFDCGKRARDWDHYLGYAEEVIFAVQPVCRSCHKKREYRRGVPGMMKKKLIGPMYKTGCFRSSAAMDFNGTIGCRGWRTDIFGPHPNRKCHRENCKWL